MSNDHVQAKSAESANLADEPTDHVAAYMAAFNSGSAGVLDDLYEDSGVVVPQPGHPMTGAERIAANRFRHRMSVSRYGAALTDLGPGASIDLDVVGVSHDHETPITSRSTRRARFEV